MTSPVGAFDIAVVDENVNVVHRSQTFYCGMINHLSQLTSKYNIEQAYVMGPETYVPQIIEELKESFPFPIQDKL